MLPLLCAVAAAARVLAAVAAAGNVKAEDRRSIWEQEHMRIFFATPQTFWNDVKKGGTLGCLRLLCRPAWRAPFLQSWNCASQQRHRAVPQLASSFSPLCLCLKHRFIVSVAGLCPYDKVVCLIVDECHRATGGGLVFVPAGPVQQLELAQRWRHPNLMQSLHSWCSHAGAACPYTA